MTWDDVYAQMDNDPTFRNSFKLIGFTLSDMIAVRGAMDRARCKNVAQLVCLLNATKEDG